MLQFVYQPFIRRFIQLLIFLRNRLSRQKMQHIISDNGMEIKYPLFILKLYDNIMIVECFHNSFPELRMLRNTIRIIQI